MPSEAAKVTVSLAVLQDPLSESHSTGRNFVTSPNRFSTHASMALCDMPALYPPVVADRPSLLGRKYPGQKKRAPAHRCRRQHQTLRAPTLISLQCGDLARVRFVRSAASKPCQQQVVQPHYPAYTFMVNPHHSLAFQTIHQKLLLYFPKYSRKTSLVRTIGSNNMMHFQPIVSISTATASSRTKRPSCRKATRPF